MSHETHAGAAVGSQEQDGMWTPWPLSLVPVLPQLRSSLTLRPASSGPSGHRPETLAAGAPRSEPPGLPLVLACPIPAASDTDP